MSAESSGRVPSPLMCVCRKCYPLDHAPATQEDLLCDCCGGRCATCRLSCEEHRRQSEGRHAHA